MSSITAMALNLTPLPVQFIHSPRAVALWIDAVAPCVVGVQSRQTYEMIYAYLNRRLVELDTIDKAFQLSQYDWPILAAVTMSRPTTPQTTMGPSTIDPVTEAEILARNLVIAQQMEDIPRIKSLLNALRTFFTRMNTNQLERIQEDASVSILWRYLRIGRDGSVTIFENLAEFDAEGEGEGEAAP